MKKRHLLLLAATAMTLAACSGDDNESATGEWNGEIRLSCGLDVQSRAATGLLYQYFDQSTEIDVQISEDVESGETATTTYGALVYETTDANGSLSLTQGDQPYYPASGNGVDIYAVYPKGSDETFTVATDQSVDADYKASDLMRASVSTERTSNAVNLEFKHLLSKVTITLKSGTGSPNLDGATVELIDVLPTTTFTASSGEIGDASGDAKYIKIFTAADKDGTDSDVLSGSCIVPPQTLGEGFVKVTLGENGVLIGKLDKGVPTLEAGKEYKYDISVNLTELSIKATITDWNGKGNSVESTAEILYGIDTYTHTITTYKAGVITADMITKAMNGGSELNVVGLINNADLTTIVAQKKSYTTLDLSKAKGTDLELKVDAFEDCGSLTSISLPDGLTRIRSAAFRSCKALASITLPDGLTKIDSEAFRGCTSLTSITLPDGLTTIGEDAFRGCTSLTSITLPDGLTKIDSEAFYGCTSLTSITLPNSLTTIEDFAFYGCTSLTSIDLSNTSLETLGYTAFEDCTSLKSITLPNSLTTIKESAFHNCENLQSITCHAEKAPTCDGIAVFDHVSTSCKLYVPSGCKSSYEAADGWSTFAGRITEM